VRGSRNNKKRSNYLRELVLRQRRLNRRPSSFKRKKKEKG
jgi:hypothetical protein